jgi:hypothetical protein
MASSLIIGKTSRPGGAKINRGADSHAEATEAALTGLIDAAQAGVQRSWWSL